MRTTELRRAFTLCVSRASKDTEPSRRGRVTSALPTGATLAASLLCLATAGGPMGCSASTAETCAPACRTGFVCLRGACVSACNPVCAVGERCTDEGICVLDLVDAGSAHDAPGDDGGGGTGDVGNDVGGGAVDAPTTDAASSDVGPPDAGAPSSCPDGEVLCGGSCRAPVVPDVGVRTPTTGRWSNDWLEEGDIAVDPCTGNVGLAWAQQVAGGANWEIYVSVVPAALGAAATAPVRITTAPGKADSVAVAWAGDSFGLFWSDPRHDAAPEACTTRCLSELYFASFDATTGVVVVPEVRLTTHAGAFRAGSTRATWGPGAREIGVTWTDSMGSREVHAAIVSPGGVMRAEGVVSAAIDPARGNSPHIVWNQNAWQLLYRHDDPDGSRPDYLHTRALDVAGTLGADLDLGVPAEQIALTARGTFGYATITTGGSPLSLRLWDLGWTATTTLASTTSTFDGTRGLAWDGANLYATSATATFDVIRYNGLGTETGRIPLTADSLERNASEIRMHRVGSRLVLMWIWGTGGLSPVIHHRVQVVETTSAM